ncbi:MAG: 4-hydroxy-tetrahydrodipicolinate synthase [Motiliproteus sp.]|jgi:4-hydroxy-tetrahydrodipicolinate synthase
MITGSLVALVTPMSPSGALDWDGLDKLIDFHIDSGTDAIVAVGTTGESATLDCQEHCLVIKHVVKRVAGRITVIAGTGANSTKEAIELTQAAKDAGVDACLLVTPYYNKPTQEGMYQHFKAIAEAVAVPQILYNVPGRTGCDMLPETVLRLTEIANIIGIKEATGDLERAKRLIKKVPEGFAVYSGDDAIALEMILLGGQGNISVTANVAPRQMAQVCALGLAGKVEEARALNRLIDHLHRDLFVESNPIPVKWALHVMGLIDCGIRLPLTPLSASYRSRIHESLKAAELV